MIHSWMHWVLMVIVYFVLLYVEWARFECLIGYYMYTMYVEVLFSDQMVFWRKSVLCARFQTFLVMLFVPYMISQRSIFCFYHECKQEKKLNHAFWIYQT